MVLSNIFKIENEAKKKADIAPLQPPTLAAFLPWGSSEGAGRVSRRKNKNTPLLNNQILTIYYHYFNGRIH